MKAQELNDWIDSLTQDIIFSYRGVSGSICPFSRTEISISYGEEEQSFESVGAAMNTPFITGESLTDICEDIVFE